MSKSFRHFTTDARYRPKMVEKVMFQGTNLYSLLPDQSVTSYQEN